jgi:hypothetical protein
MHSLVLRMTLCRHLINQAGLTADLTDCRVFVTNLWVQKEVMDHFAYSSAYLITIGKCSHVALETQRNEPSILSTLLTGMLLLDHTVMLTNFWVTGMWIRERAFQAASMGSYLTFQTTLLLFWGRARSLLLIFYTEWVNICVK